MTKRIDCFRPAVSPELLDTRNFFEMYPFDGGGSFIQQGILGSTDDRKITDAILNKGVMDDFGKLPSIAFRKFERWSTIEKSCWINRMYFLVPLARTAKLNKDKKLAGIIHDILMNFLKDNPAPTSQEEACRLQADVLYARDHDYNAKGFDFDAPIPYQWFDFQPASRIVNIVHALWFLKESSVFSDSDWKYLDDLLFLHAQNIFWTEQNGKLAPGNHQALRSMALLLASAYFKDCPEAAAWQKLAIKMCEYHILHDFFKDGMLNDLSPSYHLFETWITRDMLLIAEHENIRFAPEVVERAQKAFAVCHALQQPDGSCPAVNDAYSMNLESFLASLPPVEQKIPEEYLLPLSGIAMLRKKNFFFFFDCTPLLSAFSHYHGGKQALTLFAGGKPFLADSGCCSYDDPDFSGHYKQPFSHSTLLIDGKGDGILEGRYRWITAAKCTIGKWNNGSISSSQISEVPEWNGVTWTRTVSGSESAVTVEDQIVSASEKEMTILWNLHPDATVEKSGCEAVLTNGNVRLRVTFDSDFEIEDGMGFLNFTKVPCKKLIIRKKGNGGTFRTTFSIYLKA